MKVDTCLHYAGAAMYAVVMVNGCQSQRELKSGFEFRPSAHAVSHGRQTSADVIRVRSVALRF